MSDDSDFTAPCTCPGGPGDDGDQYACIAGTEYGPCDSGDCSGVCDPQGACPCILHTTHDGHDSGFGGTFALGTPRETT